MINVRHFLRYDTKVRFAVFTLIFLFSLLVLVALQQAWRPHLFKVSFYNIGQGDSMFIETPSRFQIIIDGGPGPQVVEWLAKDMPFYDRSIDLMISTHPDADHLSGLIDVLERYTVHTVLASPTIRETVAYKRFYEDVKNEHALFKEGRKTQKMSLPGGVTLQLLHPIAPLEKSSNDNGIVSLIEYNNFRMLLLADVSSEVERMIMPLLPQGITVVKIAHHGSKFSSDAFFLKSISPQICVIQVGENSYGHPSVQALDAIKKSGCKLWRTDTQGTLTLYSDGVNYWVK